MSVSVQQPQPSKWLYPMLCTLFLGLYCVRDLLGLSVNRFIIYAVAAVIVLVVKHEEAIAFFVSLSAFANAGFNGIFVTLLLGCILIRFFHVIKKAKIHSLFLLFFCVFEGIHFVISGTISAGTYVTYAGVLVALFAIQQYPAKRTNHLLIINSFIVFSLFFAFMTKKYSLFRHF